VNDERSERRLELKVGIFAIAIIAVGAAVVLLLGQKQHVFEPQARLHTFFAEVGGLREGAPVWLSGVGVGTVSRVAIGKPGEKLVRVDLSISRRVLEHVRQDSVATIGSQGLLGDKIVEVTLGSRASPPLQDGDQVHSEPPADINKLLEKGNAILDSAKQVADQLVTVTHELADPKTIAAFRGMIKSGRALLERAETGPGLVHSLFYDRKTANELQRITAGLDRLVEHVDVGVAKVDKILGATDAEGTQLVNNLSRAARGVATAAEQLERTKTIANVERASRDLADITGYVKSGRGTLGSLITDPTVYEQLVNVLGGVQRSRILRALVRYSIAKDEGRSAAKAIQTPVEAKKPGEAPAVLKPTRAKR
jgi:phospholipid/cholesterol/gamma-HCH transport system substrate-binding protein